MSVITIIQVVLGTLLICLVLIQNRGAGIGSTWGGSGEGYITRRGVEKLLFRFTILVAFLFILTSFSAFIS